MFYVLNDKPKLKFLNGIGCIYQAIEIARTAQKYQKIYGNNLNIYRVSSPGSSLITDPEFIFEEVK